MPRFVDTRYLTACPTEAGVYHSYRRFGRDGWVAAIPFEDGTWWEGPMRVDAGKAAEDLHAEKKLREDLDP